MKLAVICHPLRAGGGISVGKNLITALLREAGENLYLFTIPTGCGYEKHLSNFTPCELHTCTAGNSLIKRWIFDFFILPKLVRNFCPDAVIAMGNIAVPRCRAPQIIHCMHPYLYYPKQHYGPIPFIFFFQLCYLKYRLRSDLKSAKLLMCQTKVAEQRLRNVFNYSGPVHIMPYAPSILIQKVPFPEQKISCSQIARNNCFNLLCLTRYYPHKNLEIFLKLFSRHKDDLTGVRVLLTVDANQGRRARRLLRQIRILDLSDSIINVGPISHSALSEIYQQCDALILPTLLESFSATYIEAMEFDTPILTSDLDFAHCVCGEAAIYFNPFCTASIKSAILELKTQPEKFTKLVQAGRGQLQSFNTTWDNNAKSLIKEIKKW